MLNKRRPELMVVPQSELSGERPRPKKPNVPNSIVVYPIRRQKSTINGPLAFGKISQSIIYQGPSPRVCPAAT